LAIGNGTAGDVSGTLGLTTANFGGTVNGYYNAFTVLNSDAKSAGFTLEATTGWSINFLTRYGISYLEIGNTSGTAVTRRWYGVLDILDPTGVLAWASATLSTSASTNDSGISRLGAASLAIGNGTAGDFTGSLKLKSVLITDTAANTDLTVQNTTTATSSTTNASPLLELAANYWTGSASAADTWTIGSSLAAGTNGASTLSLTHSGSSGAPIISTNATFIGGTGSAAAPTYGGVDQGGLFFLNTGSAPFISVGGTAVAGWSAGPAQSLMGSTGMYCWNSGSVTGGGTDTGISRAAPGIINIGNGSVSTDASASIRCASIALNGAVASPTAGVYYSGTNAGITQSAIAVGTIGTTGGIVTTFTGVSDERLKKFTEYGGGLAEILNIVPIRYRWNEAGQKKSGQTGDRDYVGFSAQNVQKSIPEAIQGTEGEEQYLSFDDRPVIAALVNAVKELKAEIEVLKARK
jgi:hypothetical protein